MGIYDNYLIFGSELQEQIEILKARIDYLEDKISRWEI